MSNPTDDRTLYRAAHEAGLDILLETDPGLVGRARELALDYARRLRRPDAPPAEPAHVFRLRRRT